MTAGGLGKKFAASFAPRQYKAVAVTWALCAVLSIAVALIVAEI